MRHRTVLIALAILGMVTVGVWAFLTPGPASEEPGASARGTSHPRTVEIVELGTDGTQRAPGESVPRATESPAPSEPPAPVLLAGSVLGVDGRPLGGDHARVRATDAHGRRLEAHLQGGQYSFGLLEPGDWEVRCAVPGFGGEARRVVLVAGTAEHREDFLLRPEWVIAVRLVTDEGEDYEEFWKREDLPFPLTVEVLAAKDPPGDRLIPGSSGWRPARRTSRQTKIGDADVLVVSEEPPVTVFAVAAGSVLASEVASTHVDAMTLVIPMKRLRALPCSLVVRVRDADTGAPVPGVPIALFRPQGGEWSEASPTDAQGIAHAENLLPGPCTLALMTSEHAPRLVPVDLEPGTKNDLGTISLERGVSLRGRFVGPDGRGVACDASVDPYDESNPWESLPRHAKLGFTPGEDGSFALEKVIRGKYLVHAGTAVPTGDGPNWQSGPVLVDLSLGSVEGLEIRIRPAVEVRLDAAAPHVRELLLRVATAQGLPCTRAAFPPVGPARVHLVPGSYELLVERDGTIVKRVPFELGEKPMTLAIDP